MAKNENTPPDGGDNLHIEIKRVLAELTVILESVQKLLEAVLLRNQLEMLRGLLVRAVESVEGLFGQLTKEA